MITKKNPDNTIRRPKSAIERISPKWSALYPDAATPIQPAPGANPGLPPATT